MTRPFSDFAAFTRRATGVGALAGDAPPADVEPPEDEHAPSPAHITATTAAATGLFQRNPSGFMISSPP
jgi:hypothetical protein